MEERSASVPQNLMQFVVQLSRGILSSHHVDLVQSQLEIEDGLPTLILLLAEEQPYRIDGGVSMSLEHGRDPSHPKQVAELIRGVL